MSSEIYDVIVVGGGPAGVSTTHELTKRGKNVLLIEMNKEYPKVPKDWCIFGEIFKQYPWLKDSICNHIDNMYFGAATREQIIEQTGGLWFKHSWTEAYGEKFLFHVWDDKFLGAWMEKNQEQGAIYHIGEKALGVFAKNDSVKVLTDWDIYECRKLVDASGYGLLVPLQYKLTHYGANIPPYRGDAWYYEVNCKYFKGFYQELVDFGVTKNDLVVAGTDPVHGHSLPTVSKVNSGFGHAFYPWNEEDVCHEEYYMTTIFPGAPEWTIERDFKKYWEKWAYPGRSYEMDVDRHCYRAYKGFQQMTVFAPYSLENNKIFLIGDTMGADNFLFTGAGANMGIHLGPAAGEYIARLLDGETAQQLGPYEKFIFTRRTDGPSLKKVPVELSEMNRDVLVNWIRYYHVASGRPLIGVVLLKDDARNRFLQGLMTKEDILAFLKNIGKVYPKDELKERFFPRPYLMKNALDVDNKYNIGIKELMRDKFKIDMEKRY